VLLRERALSTTELSEAIGLAKGTVAHHLKVLEAAGLVRVVRTRQVRALTEKVYGRVARLFVLKSADEQDHRIRRKAADVAGFQRRLDALERDVRAAADPDGDEYEFVVSLHPSGELT
jgi:DNA-binding transcriptional ArsR family regulator